MRSCYNFAPSDTAVFIFVSNSLNREREPQVRRKNTRTTQRCLRPLHSNRTARQCIGLYLLTSPVFVCFRSKQINLLILVRPTFQKVRSFVHLDCLSRSMQTQKSCFKTRSMSQRSNNTCCQVMVKKTRKRLRGGAERESDALNSFHLIVTRMTS
jgi:hypothetical protein